MKIITKKNKNTIMLEDRDLLEITTAEKQHMKIIIKCLDGTLFMEEKTLEDIETLEEEKAIQTMKEYLKNQKTK